MIMNNVVLENKESLHLGEVTIEQLANSAAKKLVFRFSGKKYFVLQSVHPLCLLNKVQSRVLFAHMNSGSLKYTPSSGCCSDENS